MATTNWYWASEIELQFTPEKKTNAANQNDQHKSRMRMASDVDP